MLKKIVDSKFKIGETIRWIHYSIIVCWAATFLIFALLTSLLKFIYSEKATIFEETSLLVLTLLSNVKTSNLCALLRKLQLYYIAWKVAEELHTSKYILKIKKQVPLKLSFSEQATKIWKNLPFVLTLLSKHQNKWKMFSNFVAFSQCLNFIKFEQ